jgi:hypothetical protein
MRDSILKIVTLKMLLLFCGATGFAYAAEP